MSVILGQGCFPSDCEGERGERGERGKRGKRGHRGHDGHDGRDGRDGDTGATGATGATGNTGPSEGALIRRQVFNAADAGIYTPTPGTRRAIVRGAGGGGGGGGIAATGANSSAGAPGGNSGVGVEREFVAPPFTFLTGGPFTVGAAGTGGAGGAGSAGGDSTIVIEGVLLTAPGGMGGPAGLAFTFPTIRGPAFPTLTVGVDYQASDLGGAGIALVVPGGTFQVTGGTGGSGSYGIGGRGTGGGESFGNGFAANGNGAAGGGAASTQNAAARNGGDGSPGIWIIEEYS